MQKILLIIQREYLSRVRKKTFIIGTLLFPVLYLLLVFGAGFIAERSKTHLTVAIADETGLLNDSLIKRYNLLDPSSTFKLVRVAGPDTFNYSREGYDAFIHIAKLDWERVTENPLTMKTRKSYGINTQELIEAKLNSIWDEIKNIKHGIDPGLISILAGNKIQLKTLNETDRQQDSRIANAIGLIAGLLMYLVILVYGSMVMMGIMEEKTNRIAEVIVSSVKPFEMMLGKILGIGLVALTQFILWIVFIFLIYNLSSVFGKSADSSVTQIVGSVQEVFSGINIPLILFCFLFYFIGGFFFYASIYGAIGSAINEDIREAQTLSFPVTMLVVLSILVMTAAVNDPSSPLAVWASIIPFSSPIVMMARIPYGVPGTVPWWQLIASMVALVACFVITTWIAAKIYRTGILMYGKKVTWKEMLRWAFRND
ncbi:MAG: ABC transporter permease [Chitinophagaceae bacterium]|nr:ABC transporter permease [Chitinophagaceae bacterium]